MSGGESAFSKSYYLAIAVLDKEALARIDRAIINAVKTAMIRATSGRIFIQQRLTGLKAGTPNRGEKISRVLDRDHGWLVEFR